MNHGQIYFFDSFLRRAWYGQGHMPCANALQTSSRMGTHTTALVVIDGHKSVRHPNPKGI